MRTANLVVALLGGSLLLSTFFMSTAPSSFWLAIFIMALLGLVVAFICASAFGAVRWRKSYRSWMIPSVACMMFVLFAWYVPYFGAAMRERQFKRHLEEYQRIADGVGHGFNFQPDPDQNGTCAGRCSVVYGRVRVPNSPPHISRIEAARCNNNAVEVWFHFGHNVPFLREGYIFKGYNEGDECSQSLRTSKRSIKLQHISGDWYWFSS